MPPPRGAGHPAAVDGGDARDRTDRITARAGVTRSGRRNSACGPPGRQARTRVLQCRMPGRVVSRRFIGREGELARVVEALSASASGVATTVIVSGGAGMGVTRFVDEALDRLAAHAHPPLVLRGQAHGPV